MKSSNIESVFMPTGFKSNRSQFLRQITENEKKNGPNIIQIENRDGYFIEAPSLLDKYQRRDINSNVHLQSLTYLQFCMKYATTNSEPKDQDFHSVEYVKTEKGWDLDEEMNLIIAHDFHYADKHYSLPNFIRLNDIQPGEPKFMKKHRRRVIRVHKINSTKYPHEYRFSQLQMYRPFLKEEELDANNFDYCDTLFHEKSQYNDKRKIQNVKAILMPHLESVELGTERAEEIVNLAVGDTLDPNLEQDNNDCAVIGTTDHPDFVFKDQLDIRDDKLSSSPFKPIELYDEGTLLSMARNLDEDQRMVLEIGVNLAKNIVKSKKARKMFMSQELLVVQGGAGSGKSLVIDVLSQQIERILRCSGDNPEHPYCLKAAFTGTAAANIKGQTLHSAFSFSFGNDFFSLADKKETRGGSNYLTFKL